MSREQTYRPCVVGVFVNADGSVLLLHRSDTPGAWQLPQGGMEDGESPEAAVIREMWEELGTDKFRILTRSKRTVCYDWPPQARGKYKDLYRGQEQHWFKLAFEEGGAPQLDAATDPEFDAFRWGTVREAIASIIEWKRAAYIDGFKLLELMDEAGDA